MPGQFVFLTGDPSLDLLKEDIDFPFALTSTGDLAMVSGEENLETALIARALVRKGEVSHRPQYGAYNLNHQGGLADDTTLSELRAELLGQYNREDRVTNVRVDVAESTTQPGKVFATVHAGSRTGVDIGPLSIPLG